MEAHIWYIFAHHVYKYLSYDDLEVLDKYAPIGDDIKEGIITSKKYDMFNTQECMTKLIKEIQQVEYCGNEAKSTLSFIEKSGKVNTMCYRFIENVLHKRDRTMPRNKYVTYVQM